MDIEKLYREYFTPVYRYTLSLVHDHDMAEEITQETFFRALKKINNYRGPQTVEISSGNGIYPHNCLYC